MSLYDLYIAFYDFIELLTMNNASYSSDEMDENENIIER
jgi:hypothetical protein